MSGFEEFTSSAIGLSYFGVFGFLFGAVIASFLCVVFERVPRGETLNGRSHCVCGRQLSGAENIPIVSWLVLRGRSKCCKSSIPRFYVLSELFLGVSWAASGVLLGVGVLPAALLFVVTTTAFVLYGVRRGRALTA